MLKFIANSKYTTLLVSTLLLLFGQMFSPSSWGIYPKTFLYLQHGLIGLLLFFEHKALRNLFLFFFTVLAFTFWIDIHEPKGCFAYFGLLYVIYFLALSFKVFSKIFQSKKVNKEMLSAVICGFVFLILIASIVFITTESIHENSFSNLGKGLEKWNNLRYYSFISILTVGFGDIAPLTPIAKNLTAMVTLLGHFYTVVVTGIFIGKYIGNTE